MNDRGTTTETQTASRSSYRQEGGKTCIDIRLRSARQLFDGRDPAPFRERDLDENAVDYIISSAEEAPARKPLKLVVWITEESSRPIGDAIIIEAVRAHFSYRIERTQRDIRQHVRFGQLKLVLGLAVLAVFLTLAELCLMLPENTLRQILREGLAIVGWVAMWRPSEVLLYDWWPLVRERNLLRRIEGAEIAIVHEPAGHRLPSVVPLTSR
jgi:hypothetical protein